jgi:molybdopterin-guanine dinucleotide biosynthesis protein B
LSSGEKQACFSGKIGSDPTVVSIVGKSNSGKTTLIEALIPALLRKGLKVGTIKHNTHGFTLDYKGKDSYRHQQAGAQPVALSAPEAFALVKQVAKELTVAEIITNYMFDLDIVLTEGYKEESWPKIEVVPPDETEILTKDNLLAVVSWQKRTDLPQQVFTLDNIDELAELILTTKQTAAIKKEELSFG